MDARLGGFAEELTGPVGGDHDDAQRGPERPRFLDELEAVQLRHQVVHDEQVGGDGGGEMRQRLARRREAVDRVALRAEDFLAHLDDRELVVDDHDGHARARSSRRSLYSIESTSACQDASMMLSATPTVPHVSSPSPEVISTRVFAAVPLDSSRMRTL